MGDAVLFPTFLFCAPHRLMLFCNLKATRNFECIIFTAEYFLFSNSRIVWCAMCMEVVVGMKEFRGMVNGLFFITEIVPLIDQLTNTDRIGLDFTAATHNPSKKNYHTLIYSLARSRKCGFSPLLSKGIDVSPNLWCQMKAGVTPFMSTYNGSYIGIWVKLPAGYLKSNDLGQVSQKSTYPVRFSYYRHEMKNPSPSK